jgi:hypothetical protein
MTSNNRSIALAAAMFVLTAVPAVHAAMEIAATFDEKVENAASIILGKCVKSESRLDPSGRWILTYSTFEVEKSLKGVTPQQVTLVVPGGTVGSVHQQTIGMPTFRDGDEHVVFVKNTRFGPTVLYFDQGAYSVKTDDHGDKVVAPVPTNVVKVDTQRGMGVAPNDMPRTMRDFEQAVSDSLRDSRDRKMRMNAMTAEKATRDSSLWSIIARNKFFIVIALAGIAFATWQLLRR